MSSVANAPAPRRPAGRVAMYIVVGALAALAALAATVFAGAAWLFERQAVDAALDDTVRQVQGGIARGSTAAFSPGRTWLAGPLFNASREFRELRVTQPDVVASIGGPPPTPTITAERRVQVGNRTLTVTVRRSLRPMLYAVGGAALAFALLAWSCWTLFLRRPFRDLRLLERRHDAMCRRDALTGLLNREGLYQTLDATLRLRKSQGRVGILLIDVDRFHEINDALGEPAGNELLCRTATRILGLVRKNDPVARLGGDQFAVMVEGVAGAQVLDAMARNLLRSFESGLQLGDSIAIANLSIGQAVADRDDDTADGLLKRADSALRRAKADGGARTCAFDSSMDIDHARQLELDMSLRRAVAQNGFALAFQPIMDAPGRRVVAVEALLRWSEPGRGPVSPDVFIPILERTGLIVAVGQWVLRESCRQAVAWLAGGRGALRLSVNVSPRQFVEPDFAAHVVAILEATGFPAGRLQLEVTERLLLDPTPAIQAKVAQLSALGIRLALDDFGMGHSSLAYLKSFPLHTLKIDRMFVNDMLRNDRETAIVRAIVELGHSLGMQVTAEGVETESQQRALASLGCDSLQGFLFARPMDAERIVTLLERPMVDDDADRPPSGWSQTMSSLLTTT